jgi:hypothetical protein
MKIRYFRPKGGDLRVWNMVNMNPPVYHPVRSIAHAKQLIDAMAQSQLLNPQITDNAFGLEVYEGGEWVEWSNENGDTIDVAEEDDGDIPESFGTHQVNDIG